MALNYSIAMLKNPQKKDERPRAYAKSRIVGELILRELERCVLSQTTVSRANVSAVIISTVENMFDGLCNGEQVDFGDLGKFRLQVTSKGADTAEKFTATNITGVNIQFVPGEDLKNIFASMEFVPLPTRTAMKTVVKAQKAGQTPVDISGKCGSDNGSDGGNTGGSDPDEGQEENPLG